MAVVWKAILQLFPDVLNGSIGRMEDAQAQPLHVFHQAQEIGAGEVCRAVGTKASVIWDHRGATRTHQWSTCLRDPWESVLNISSQSW